MKDKGAVQHADTNANRRDKGAVEAHVSAGGLAIPIAAYHYNHHLGSMSS